MAEVIYRTNQKARKKYDCEGKSQIDEFDEKGCPCSGVIEPGDVYQRQYNKYSDGDGTYVWRSCLPCMKIISENDYIYD